MRKAYVGISLIIACAVLADCMSADSRSQIFYILTGCKKKTRTCSGGEPVVNKDAPRKQAPKEVPKDEKEASDYMTALYERMKDDFRRTDPNLREIPNGFRGRGIELTKVPDEQNEKVIKALTMTIDGDIAFPTGGSNLTLEAQDLVDRIGRAFADFPHLRLEVYGHTDTPGTFEGNQALSEARAKTIQTRVLSVAKVDPKRFTVVKGLADSHKLVQTNESEKRNRRVEIRVAK